MPEIVGVRFRDAGKVYYFDPDGAVPELGCMVVVETARGLECGQVALTNCEVPEERVFRPLKRVVRIADGDDLARVEKNRELEVYAMQICSERIVERAMDMKLVGVECAFDGSKIMFYFTADGRVDFRELVKDLASVFRTRIELRQIGVRDEAKMLGGLGICGRPFCCSTFLDEFQPVSIKMAQEQGLSLNPSKISGSCGRLMCCLKYEQAAYEDLLRSTPKVGSAVTTPEGRGVVVEVALLTGQIKVRLEEDESVKTFSVGDLTVSRPMRQRQNVQEHTAEPSQEAQPQQQRQRFRRSRSRGQRPRDEGECDPQPPRAASPGGDMPGSEQ